MNSGNVVIVAIFLQIPQNQFKQPQRNPVFQYLFALLLEIRRRKLAMNPSSNQHHRVLLKTSRDTQLSKFQKPQKKLSTLQTARTRREM